MKRADKCMFIFVKTAFLIAIVKLMAQVKYYFNKKLIAATRRSILKKKELVVVY